MIYFKVMWPEAIILILGAWWLMPFFSYLWTFFHNAIISQTKYNSKDYLWYNTIMNFYGKLANPHDKKFTPYNDNDGAEILVWLVIPLVAILFWPIGIPIIGYIEYLIYQKYIKEKEKQEEA